MGLPIMSHNVWNCICIAVLTGQVPGMIMGFSETQGVPKTSEKALRRHALAFVAVTCLSEGTPEKF